jgi:hypothetical protein
MFNTAFEIYIMNYARSIIDNLLLIIMFRV